MDVKAAIQDGNAAALRRLLSEDVSRANALIRWGPSDCILTQPLHYVWDVLFDGTLKRGWELPLIDALIEAGADVDFQSARDEGRYGDTPLIGAASLGAEEVGLRLLDAGADSTRHGIIGETALHWAAMLGEDRLARQLIRSSDLSLRDEKYDSPPLGWAIHGCYNVPAGNVGRQRVAVAELVLAGARVEPEWLESEQVRADAAMMDALSGKSTASR